MTKKQKIFTASAFMILAVLALCVTIYAKNHKVANTAYAGKTEIKNRDIKQPGDRGTGVMSSRTVTRPPSLCQQGCW
jgi:hypothetical protein